MKATPGFLPIAVLLLAATAQAQTWQLVDDPEALADLFRDRVMEATLAGGAKAVARYRRDGTGVLEAWGDRFDRRWEVKGTDQVCIEMGRELNCFRIERNLDSPGEYRAQNQKTGETLVFTVRPGEQAIALAGPAPDGGAAKPSAEEIAAKLANPNTPLASLTLKLQYRTFQGDLPDADDQDATSLLFQPSLPFALANGDLILFRPAIPVFFDQPVFDPDDPGFDSRFGLGDIVFDLAYARTTDSGLLLAAGLVSSLPTATRDGLGTDRWTLGPELLLGKLTTSYVVGVFPNHQSDVAGSGDADISLTTVQAFGTWLPGGGWNVGTAPIMSYDHESSQWTIPLNLTFGKTVIWGGRPWKLNMEINYYVEQPDAFGPQWFVGFNVAPVVENVLARLFH
jgi:hypothetical protein